MVKVRLVEKRVKREVGIVMLAKVMSWYRIPGMTLIRRRVNLPNIPSQDRDSWAAVWISLSAIVVARALAVEFIEAVKLAL